MRNRLRKISCLIESITDEYTVFHDDLGYCEITDENALQTLRQLSRSYRDVNMLIEFNKRRMIKVCKDCDCIFTTTNPQANYCNDCEIPF